MKFKTNLIVSLFMTVTCAFSMGSLGTSSTFAEETGAPPPPPPPPPPLPGASGSLAQCPKGVSQQELAKMLNKARRAGKIELKEGVEEVAKEMLKTGTEITPPKTEAAAKKVQKPVAEPKSDAAMQAELAERLKQRALRSSTSNVGATPKPSPAEPAVNLKSNLRSSSPGRVQGQAQSAPSLENASPNRFPNLKRKAPADSATTAPGDTGDTTPTDQPSNPWGAKLRKTGRLPTDPTPTS